MKIRSEKQKKQANKNKTKQNKKVIWESLVILAGTIAAFVRVGVEKNTNLRKKTARKVLEILRKIWDNKKKLLKGLENLFDVGKNSRYRDSRYREFFALIKS